MGPEHTTERSVAEGRIRREGTGRTPTSRSQEHEENQQRGKEVEWPARRERDTPKGIHDIEQSGMVRAGVGQWLWCNERSPRVLHWTGYGEACIGGERFGA